jgi:hypothetical protein
MIGLSQLIINGLMMINGLSRDTMISRMLGFSRPISININNKVNCIIIPAMSEDREQYN